MPSGSMKEGFSGLTILFISDWISLSLRAPVRDMVAECLPGLFQGA